MLIKLFTSVWLVHEFLNVGDNNSAVNESALPKLRYARAVANDETDCWIRSFPQFVGASDGNTYINTMQTSSGSRDPSMYVGGYS